MTTKADFTEEEWKLVGGPPSAGLIVLTVARVPAPREPLVEG